MGGCLEREMLISDRRGLDLVSLHEGLDQCFAGCFVHTHGKIYGVKSVVNGLRCGKLY